MSDSKNIQAIPMAKKSASDQIENELGEHLSTSKITSEIDYLKKMKLRSYLQTHGSDEAKAIASFQSQDDKRKEKTYVKLIELYKSAEREEQDELEGKTKTRAKRNQMSSIYASFGYEDLYSIACVISEIQRVKQSNKNVLSIIESI